MQTLRVCLGFRKKGEALANQRDCDSVRDWLASIVNHMFWAAQSSHGSANYGELVVQKWQSVINHVQNVHEGHGDLFPACLHEPQLDRKWLVPRKNTACDYLYILLLYFILCRYHWLKHV